MTTTIARPFVETEQIEQDAAPPIEQAQQERPSPRLAIRMSSAGHCRRQIAYEVLGYAESDPTPAEGRNILELGNASEAVLVNRMIEEGWELDLTRWDGGEQIEVTLDDPPRVGHPDGRCRHLELTRNFWVLFEAKAMNARGYQRFLTLGMTKSHPQYIDQTAQYGVAMHESGLVADPCVAVFAAVDRDTGRWGFQRVRWDREVFARRTAELAEAWTAIAQDNLPERDHDGTTWHCDPRYCRFSTFCWPGQRPIQTAPAEGALDAAQLGERDQLEEAASLWRDGHDLELRGKSLQDGAKTAFSAVLSRHQAKQLAVGGLTATAVNRTRRSWDEKVLRKFLSEAQLSEAQKLSEGSLLQIRDSLGDEPGDA